MTVAEKDYKQTLNLPETTFPMQASLAQREPQMLARWETEHVYAKVGDETAGRPAYWFVDGPPYANGDIHIGHVVNKVLKDIVVKAARLDGHYAPFVPGWDCHGLPIELQVEKKHGKVGDKLDAKAFRAKCREYAAEQIDRQRADFRRLGIIADWEHPYLTMAPGYEAEQLRALAKIVERGHVVRGAKPVHWCLDCGSSLAEAEVEYEDKKSPAIDVKFVAVDAAEVARRFGATPGGDVGFVIWTTTPWTLPASQAITVHPDFDYVLADVASHGRLVVVEPLLEAFAKRLGGAARVLGRAKGAALKGLRAQHPFADRSVPVILGGHVTLDAGTGLVHTAPAHGIEDFIVGQEYGLSADNPVAANGVFVSGTPLVAGQHVRRADALVIEGLRTRGALVHQQEITHSYPHCWRHKTPLIFRATRQWFVSMDVKGLRDAALSGIAATEWIPDWGEARIAEMVSGRPDWCISRQRYWGVPLAFFVDKQTGALHPDTPTLLRKVADKVQREGLEAWFGSTAADWLAAGESARYDKLTDTLDVWFDSGVVHQCSFATQAPEAMKDGIAPVADMYLEGSDQHRGWFMSSLLTSSAMYGRAPFKAVLTHGFTVDEQGRKMSKSLGNVIAPQQVLKTLGADVMRLWVAASDYSGEIAISDNLLKRMGDAYRRIRNTVRYLLGSLHGFDPAQDLVAPDQLLAIDRWAVDSTRALQDEIAAAYRSSQFHLVYQKVHNYAVDLGALYLDVLKDRLYTMPAKSPGRRSAQTALLHIAEALVRWIAPVLSFTADEIWRLLPGDRSHSVFSQAWHVLPPAATARPVDFERLRAVRVAVSKVLEDLRVKGAIGQSLAAEVTLYAEEPLLAALKAPGDELRYWFITSRADARPAAQRPAGALAAALEDGGTVWIEAAASAAPKCERCWHRRPEVGEDKAHPTLCGRCVENVAGAGETRRYI
jgi:isoleucyl-tRNA synthetase